jgi:hypothetical protein
MRSSILASVAVAAALATTAGCSSNSASQPTTVHQPTTTAAAPIQPVPDTHKNKYNVGPFTITLVQGIAQEPRGVTGSEVLVENTSMNFIGVAQPEVQYSVGNEVVGTNTGHTDILKPGQKQTLWIDVVVNRDVTGQYGDAQLISLWYSTGMSQPGTTRQLAF